MLWETGDPNRALVERFGFNDLASAEDWLSPTLGELIGRGVAHLRTIAAIRLTTGR